MLTAKVNGIDVGNPVLTFSEKGNSRSAYLLGENSWKWRMESHVINQSYEKYDQFIDKIIQYLFSDLRNVIDNLCQIKINFIYFIPNNRYYR